jgi:ureidoglycolate hydrolase
MPISIYSHDGEGLSLAYEGDNRVLGLKNYQKANNIFNLKEMERHLETDEQFVLFEGSCLLISLEDGSVTDFDFIWLKSGVLYSVPKGLWHATVMTEGTKMMLAECSGTTFDNSERMTLSNEQLEIIQQYYAC